MDVGDCQPVVRIGWPPLPPSISEMTAWCMLDSRCTSSPSLTHMEYIQLPGGVQVRGISRHLEAGKHVLNTSLGRSLVLLAAYLTSRNDELPPATSYWVVETSCLCFWEIEAREQCIVVFVCTCPSLFGLGVACTIAAT